MSKIKLILIIIFTILMLNSCVIHKSAQKINLKKKPVFSIGYIPLMFFDDYNKSGPLWQIKE